MDHSVTVSVGVSHKKKLLISVCFSHSYEKHHRQKSVWWVMFVRAKSLKMSTFEVVLKNDKGTSTVLLAAGTDSIVI